ncbi:DUF2169 domain-containing protein [Sorangium sp. So ce1036]|uniref:DUF2169 family type VI secretion system accessory protein n=1 Tax=Sorangium sp. So ce1036 TaxID=3133328 RepID=UPI003F008281
MTPLPGAEAAAVPWRTQGRLHVTVIAKASFAFAPDAVMWRTEPQEILRAEVHHGRNPARSIRFSADLAPYLGRADVLFTGDAHAPRGAQVQSLPVRLAVYGASGCALDKRLLVRDVRPFRRMPIVYERAAAGVNGWENPFGVAAKDGQANLVDLRDPTRPAGFGPIARAWPARHRLLGGTPREALEGPNAEIPAGFDWSYFQAAPADQRIAFLQGDEWIVLENLSPLAPRLQMRLPRARGVARIQGLTASAAAEGELVELYADTLRIDGAEQRCTVVWRRILPVPGDDALAALRIVAGVAVEGEEIAWPDLGPEPGERVEAAPPPPRRLGPEGTLRIEDAPGEAGAPRVDPGLTVGLSDQDVELVDAAPGPSIWETVALPRDQAEPARRAPALPFKPVAPPPGPAQQDQPGAIAAQLRDLPTTTTLALSSADEAQVSVRPATPFPIAPCPAPRVAPATPLPGAPWSGERAAPARERDEPGQLPPLGDGDEVSLARCAIVAAELAERPVPRAEVLRAHGLTEERWEEAERRWQASMAEEARRRERALRDRFDAAYVAAWEAVRGALSPADYARLVVAAERGGVASLLDELALRRTVWARMKRLWAARLAGDPRLRERVEAEIARLSGAPGQRERGGAPAARAARHDGG